MLKSFNSITNCQLQAIDGEIGRCQDFLFDDRHWTIRYMVANTHKWMPGGRRTLISPVSLGQPDWVEEILPVNLKREAIKNSPPLEEHEPVSAQYERDYFNYYGYGYYWMGSGLWGTYANPAPLLEAQGVKSSARPATESEIKEGEKQDRHLRSSKEVAGYAIHATDDTIGHVEDFLVNTDSWAIAYLVVDTRNWLPGGRKVMLEPEQIQSVDWASRSVKVTLTTEQIKQSPEYNPEDVNQIVPNTFSAILRHQPS